MPSRDTRGRRPPDGRPFVRPSSPVVGARSFGCCEKSALNRGVFGRVRGLGQLGGCFRDWEATASALPPLHAKFPNQAPRRVAPAGSVFIESRHR